MRLPDPVGDVSSAACRTLRDGGAVPDHDVLVARVTDPVRDLDLQLALTCLNEMHYRGFDDVPDGREWEPGVVALRAGLEARFEAALAELVPDPEPALLDLPVHEGLREVVVSWSGGPSLSGFLLKRATLTQFREFLVQRSLYNLKEADPHTWVIPRLSGDAKAALVAIQSDEYGGGRPAAVHAALFAQAMRALGLDDTYGAYWDQVRAEQHATVNLMTLLGLHRRHRGAAAGHLAALEMTSTEPNRRYGNGLRRLGVDAQGTAYFDEHVEADAVHEQIAAVDLCGSLVRDEPDLRADVLRGAAACLALDRVAGDVLLEQWDAATVPAA